MSRGLLIVLEGGDSVGKTTQSRFLDRWLASHGVDHMMTREPGGTPLGSRIRTLLLDPASGTLDDRAEALLYAADKAQHVTEVMRPALERGQLVVCDRYIDSTLAYQGAGRVLDAAQIDALARWATDGLRPDLTVLLDADPAETTATIVDKDRMESESLDFHRRVRDEFLALAARDPQHYLVLPARDPRDRIAAAVRERLAPMLGIDTGSDLSDPDGTMRS
ncbi:dTMP kinase [Acidipropionibacterium virtanenii]|uniref:Thymidylate kinase n=1 Tax=Acidipropionibacterium virtanenii TaxID=2057246 RepID=A0A344URB0_9ACTN|nr:dTMP kinase [Acidipropionibacterium virtanenii]AXE37808.1 Thymidylate kinase [Acidipropionibacterium virtanenii]